MKLTFIGAAHEVTGSCTLLECCGGNFLIDYGMEQGVNVFENVPLPVLPGQIDAVFLTHAHIDHSGMLPKLYKDGFRGKVYATQATENLCRIMLMDSAAIQMSDAEWLNRKAVRAGRATVDPVYTTEDAAGALRLLRPCRYGERIKAAEGVDVRFTDVGHLLGAACVELWLTEDGETRKLVFSGDVGNTGLPLIGAPLTVDEADYLVIEATYGNRLHEKPGDTVAELAAVLLQHMILSHHGEPEFGAAVKPICAESELLSQIDMLDSRMEIYRETLAGLQVGEVSSRIFALDKRVFKPHELNG